jgi:hypothetical protein
VERKAAPERDGAVGRGVLPDPSDREAPGVAGIAPAAAERAAVSIQGGAEPGPGLDERDQPATRATAHSRRSDGVSGTAGAAGARTDGRGDRVIVSHRVV